MRFIHWNSRGASSCVSFCVTKKKRFNWGKFIWLTFKMSTLSQLLLPPKWMCILMLFTNHHGVWVLSKCTQAWYYYLTSWWVSAVCFVSFTKETAAMQHHFFDSTFLQHPKRPGQHGHRNIMHNTDLKTCCWVYMLELLAYQRSCTTFSRRTSEEDEVGQ